VGDVNYSGWDDHRKLFETYKGDRLKNFDAASALPPIEGARPARDHLVVALGELAARPR